MVGLRNPRATQIGTLGVVPENHVRMADKPVAGLLTHGHLQNA
jgi:hypothetical protein